MFDIFKRKPPTERETFPTLLSEPPSIADHLDVGRVFSVTKAAEQGNVRDLFALYRDVIVSDSHMQGEISKRKLAVLGDRMTVLPWDKSDPSNTSAATVIEDEIHNCKSWKDACIHLLDGTLWPVALVEKVYQPTATGYKLKTLVPVPHYLLDYTAGHMRISDVDHQTGTILPTFHDPDPERYIIHRGHLLTAPDTWGGPMRSILYWWLLGTMTRDWWSRFLDRYGSPFLVGRYPKGDDTSRNVLRDAFKMSVRLGGLVVNEDTKVELIQAAAGQTGAAYEKFLSICQREKSKLILGQTLSAEAQSTGMNSGTSNMQEGVRQDIRSWDSSSLADTFRVQLFDQYLRINGSTASTPTLTWGSVSDAELKVKAEVLKNLKDAGLTPTLDGLKDISRQLSIPLERLQTSPGLMKLSAMIAAGDIDLTKLAALEVGASGSFLRSHTMQRS